MLDFKASFASHAPMAVPSPDPLTYATSKMRPLPHLIFMSRWLQLPLYLGLIVAQVVYVWQFWVELVHLVEAAMGSESALAIAGVDRLMPAATFRRAEH